MASHKEDLWDIRWWTKKILASQSLQEAKTLAQQQHEVISVKLGEKPAPVEPVRPNPGDKGAGLKWIPFAHIMDQKMRTQGRYAGAYPKGAVVHFTAGRSKNGFADAKGSYSWGREQGYVFLVIARNGEILQGHPVDEFGSHAGVSKWQGLGDSVSSKLIGIEIACAGHVEKVAEGKFKSWFNEYYTADEVRYVTEEKWGCPTGYYHKYSPEQEASLIQLLQWLKQNDNTDTFNFDFVLGHHEVAGKKGIGYWRKNDPGGSLSMSMDELRAKLKAM